MMEGTAPPSKPKKEPKVEAPRAMECADCHKSFADRHVFHWDVHLPEGGYVTVCTPCFEKRDQSRISTERREADKPLAKRRK
ncbi:MAG: hypothetical protein KGJ23_13860 [Euryarchaeota archaeon]|nr:hypothetical protein [Euryarchaeota archaeon]MDE1837683.1 hypothetical protein [Euryarchaeota archaeon]MDE1881799.1 hypothetical protein [Euryarchaeota archaeon]MDE2045987.1 hypothetical protein [Thermoplasmata archaeon]